ncbi:MAG: ArnT family glycosyltransferase [Hyphomicrobiales bacterium]
MLILLYVVSLYHRIPHTDDAWLGEHAYWFSKEGYVKSELLRGFDHQQEKLLSNHKLETYIGGFFISVFGFSLYTLKSSTLVLFAIFIVVLIFYMRRRFLQYKRIVIPFSLNLLIGSALIFEYSFVFRPEILLMLLGFVSFIFLERFLVKGKPIYNAIISGVFAGLAAFGHLNGLTFMVSGGLMLLVNKRYKALVLFAIFSVVAFSMYFLGFHDAQDFLLWKEQLTYAPSEDNMVRGIFSLFLNNILDEHMRFFHSPKEISISVLIIFSLIVLLINVKENDRINLSFRYLIIMMISLAFIAIQRTSKYSIIYYPYYIILISELYTYIYKKGASFIRNHWSSRLFVLLLLVFLITNTVYSAILTSKKWDMHKENELMILKYIDEDPKDIIIASPMIYIFDHNIEHFKRIQAILYFSKLEVNNQIDERKQFLLEGDKDHINYYFLSNTFMKNLGMQGYKKGDVLYGKFKIIESRPDWMVIKRE